MLRAALTRIARPAPALRSSMGAARFAVASRPQCAFFHAARSLRAESTKAPEKITEEPKLSIVEDVQMLYKSTTAGLSNPTSHWAFERLLSISLVPSMFLGCFVDNVFVDVAIVLALVPHCHMGMQQVLMDYVHPRKFGAIGTMANVLLGCATALALLGLLKLALFDGGVCKTVKQMIHA